MERALNMSFSPREKVAEGRMRGGRFRLAARPLILILLPEVRRDALPDSSLSQKKVGRNKCSAVPAKQRFVRF
ncbi:MAG: hypothetical protein CMJ50_04345 [Planctomycetaceae bacterium]|nr:hypothetical protein [Planctomycetaceae bacterium]